MLTQITAIERIEYDVTVQISALQNGVCARVRGGVLTGNAAYIADIRVWTRIRLDLQDGDFQSKKGVIQYGLYNNIGKKSRAYLARLLLLTLSD